MFIVTMHIHDCGMHREFIYKYMTKLIFKNDIMPVDQSVGKEHGSDICAYVYCTAR
jgi:hypothetical protein